METIISTISHKGADNRKSVVAQIHKEVIRNESSDKNQAVTKKDLEDLIAIKEERQLREKNQSRLSLSIGLVVSLLLVNVAFHWRFVDHGAIDALDFVSVDEVDELYEIPETYQTPPPPPQKQVQYQQIVEVMDEEVIEEEVQIDLDVEVLEETALAEVIFEEQEEVEEEEVEEIFQIVEQAPVPVGGMGEFYKYVSENLDYPPRALRQNIQGRVFVQFVVNSTGQISDVKVIKGIGEGCDEEAQSIIENAPDWVPGRQRGKPVKVMMVMPITFRLADR